MTILNLETLVTFSDNLQDEIHFDVPSNWLWKFLLESAVEDYEDNNEQALKVRAELMYDNLLSDKYKAQTVYEVANDEGVIINLKEVVVNK